MVLSLRDFCLETIVDNIHRYNLAFNTTEDDAMKRDLEFLQRRYSFEVLAKLSTKLDSLEEYVDLLINKYLKILDTAWLRNCSWEKVTSKIAEIGSNIENLILQTQDPSDFCERWSQSIICYFPNLKSIICHFYSDDLILEKIAMFCPNIEEIDISSSTITFTGIKNLCKNENGEALCTKLKKLYLSNSQIENICVEYLLKHKPSLEIIDYRYLPYVLYWMHKDDYLVKVNPYNITKLTLLPYERYPLGMYRDIIKVCLSVCTHLEYLTYTLFDKIHLTVLPNLPKLKHLFIANLAENSLEINIDEVLESAGKNLKFLSIEKCTVSVSVLAKSCPLITAMNLNEVRFRLDDNTNPVFKSLSSLTFRNINIAVDSTSRAISLLLSSSKNFETLKFERCKLSFEVKEDILRCCKLYRIKQMSFCGSRVENEYLKNLLLNGHSLRYLKMYDHFLNEKEEHGLLKFANSLPNKPKIGISKWYRQSVSPIHLLPHLFLRRL